MNLDGCSGEKLTNQNHSGEKSTNHNQETRRRSRNPEKLSLPIRSFTLDKDDEYFDPNSSPGTLTQPYFFDMAAMSEDHQYGSHHRPL